MKKKLIMIALASLVLPVVMIVIALLISPKNTHGFIGVDGGMLKNSIAEIHDIEINGVSQRVLIRGENLANPVLLHVHGGPGGVDQAVIRGSGVTLEDIFTVVYWDQRGAGASYRAMKTNDMINSLTLEQIVDDGVELTRYLRERFQKQKVYLQAHSWGTLVGVHMISKAPNYFHAYFGIGQMADSRRSEKLSYSFTLNQAKLADDKKALAALQKIGSPPYQDDADWISNVMIERGLLHQYELPDGSETLSMFDTYKLFTLYREYSLMDKLNSLAGVEMSMQQLWMEAINANLFLTHTTFSIPVYIFQGKYDKHTVTEVALDYFQAIAAPHKEYFDFSESAHWPHIKEQAKYKSIVEKIISKESSSE